MERKGYVYNILEVLHQTNMSNHWVETSLIMKQYLETITFIYLNLASDYLVISKVNLECKMHAL